ncbi:MAG: hypothetical protein JWP91_411 [Fibrobacteres bacterium]|nr:hypothetical protein [Fibrobacterota bacterium]
MKERSVSGLAGLIALASTALIGQAAAKVVLYPGPPGITQASDRQVTADGQAVFVYEAPVNFNRVFSLTPTLATTPVSYFDFSGSVTVTVTAPGVAITTAVIRPLSYGVQPTISGDKLTFTLTKPGHLTLELNNLPNRALHLFADSIEANPAHNGDANVRYFGPGVHDAGEMNLGTGQTIYIAGGAMVYGAIRGGSINNATVRGRGILNGGKIPRDKGWQNLINVHSGSSNINLNGIILFDSPTWNINTRQTTGMHINDVKIIGARPNSDGMDFVGCQNSTVDRCFVRAWDDCLCVKTDNTGNSNGIAFQGCTIWTDLAQSMEIGYETRSDVISNITFKNIDVIHAFHKPVMSIHVGDRATISDIHYEDIRVEDARLNNVQEDNLLIDIWIGTGVWTQDAERGKVNNVTFKNINMTGGRTLRNRISGFDGSHRVTGVTIENLTILGKPIKSLADGNFITVNADAPTFLYNITGVLARWMGRGHGEASLIPMREGLNGGITFRHSGAGADAKASLTWNAAGRASSPIPGR